MEPGLESSMFHFQFDKLPLVQQLPLTPGEGPYEGPLPRRGQAQLLQNSLKPGACPAIVVGRSGRAILPKMKRKLKTRDSLRLRKLPREHKKGIPEPFENRSRTVREPFENRSEPFGL